jgi:ABC transporter with metal-binding/Fe-S-binding domain ATP-binding protein
MKIAALFSGGKDSIYSIYIASQYGWEITHLVTVKSEQKDSWMFHTVNIDLTEILSKALQIPIIIKETHGHKEKELIDLKNILQNLDIDGVISGAIASEYQRTRIEKICHELKIKSFTPLWHKNQTLLLKEQINAGFRIKIVGTFAHGFDETWLGKTIDQTTINELEKLKKKYSINTAGEGGEYETLVIDGPIFKKQLKLEKSKITWKRDNGFIEYEKVKLEEK